ncbi:VOC family protein [Caenispirillum salinarum]|uniref:VOC family protein n=1 Tax=Caenispirillum salinarum TaxID=859058 RepID=UPI0005B77879|nr:VOC family protein [Caenispirillum salinarum]
MVGTTDLGVLFVAGFGPIARTPARGCAFWRDTLGLPLTPMEGNPDYLVAHGLEGAKHFAVWPLAQAAQSCFGTEAWPEDVPVPQCWVEFDVADLERATALLKERGCALLVENRKEPWGQRVSRLLAPEGTLIGVTHTPALREGGGEA